MIMLTELFPSTLTHLADALARLRLPRQAQ